MKINKHFKPLCLFMLGFLTRSSIFATDETRASSAFKLVPCRLVTDQIGAINRLELAINGLGKRVITTEGDDPIGFLRMQAEELKRGVFTDKTLYSMVTMLLYMQHLQ